MERRHKPSVSHKLLTLSSPCRSVHVQPSRSLAFDRFFFFWPMR